MVRKSISDQFWAQTGSSCIGGFKDRDGKRETGDRRQEKAKDFCRDDQFGRLQHNGRFYNEIILQPVYPFVIAKKNVHQLAEAVNSLIFHSVWINLAVNFVEEFPGAFDLCFFDLTSLLDLWEP